MCFKCPCSRGREAETCIFFFIKTAGEAEKEFFFLRNKKMQVSEHRRRGRERAFFLRKKKCRSQSTGREAEKETKTESETEAEEKLECV